jgi:hypothetical protein
MSDGAYTLSVVVPAVSGAQLAYEYWDRRAKELCVGGHFKKNIFRAERPNEKYDIYGGRPGEFILQGYLSCIAPASGDDA